ncbi:MAG: S8 family serine peptidase, partial [Pseudomonadota bacterium]
MRVLSAFALALVGAALAASPPAFSATEQPARFQASGQSKLDSAGRKLYIIQLVGDGALATPDPRLAPTRKAMRENTAQAATERKAARNAAVQSRLMAKLGPAAEQVYSYRYSFNGLALKLTPAEAQRLRRDPDVVAIWEDSVRKLSTNASPEFLGLFANDGGLIGDLGLRGEDVIIGIIDSGIAPEHPSFHDTAEPEAPRLCSTSFRDSFLGLWLCRRFEARPDVLQYESIPAGWAGSCEAGEQFSADDCNNKLIGARFFIAAAEANQQIDPREIRSPRDTDGHGTHIASTAAGNRVTARINGANVARIQGIAPRARVAAYKACWLEPGAVRASCNTADLAMAIDTAVADGVDIISYSVGNDLQTVSSADSLALLAAAKAGIFTAVAAGNDGPDLGTIGSPAGSPWVTAVAASSRAGAIFEEAIEIAAPSDLAGKIAAREANFTEPLADTGTIEGRLVVVDDGSDVVTNNDSIGTDDDGCQPYDNAADVSGNIAYVRRSGCLFSVKLDNAVDAGAEAVVVFSNAGPPVIMTSTDSTRAAIPAVMIGQATGLDLLDRLLDDDTIEVRLANGLFLSETQPGNFVGSFSSRGPSLGAPDVLKPDVTAPGIDILAALSPTRANGPQGVNYGYLTGTSMATPHIAGIAALLKEAHPDWSPAMLRSALMTSAYVDDVFRGDDVAADAFDRGAGHVDPNAANRAALVYDASAVDYDAFGCGLEPPIVAPARCTELASANVSFAAVDFNQPSLSVFRLTDARTIRRTVTNLGPTA